MLRRFSLILVLLSLLLSAMPVRAQGQAFAQLSELDTSQFPNFTALLDVFDEQGHFVRGLENGGLSLLEDGQTLPAQVESLSAPLRLAVAINASPSLAVRDGFGVSRYDKIQQVLLNWAASRPTQSGDLISLTWNGGIVASQAAPATWRNKLEVFDPQLRTSNPSSAAFAYALDSLEGAPAAPGAKPAVLLISPHLDNDSQAGLVDFSARAAQRGVRVYVWLVDSNDFLNHSSAQALRGAAAQAGGRSLNFTGSETLPNPEEWFGDLRQVYRLTYASRLTQSGQHSLSALVETIGLTSNALSFAFDIQPPSPVLLSPPAQIVRQNEKDPFDLENSQPQQQTLEMLVEFPDKHPRPLRRTALYVDGTLEDENTAPPFETFVWDLKPYLASAPHTLTVEVEDDLGLRRSSAELTVQVTVIQPPGGIAGLLMRNQLAVTLLAIMLAGIILLAALFFGRRLTWKAWRERRQERARRLDPVTQPLVPAAEARSQPFAWIRRRTPPAAYLVKLTAEGLPASADPIPLPPGATTFGQDPTQASHLFSDDSISPIHARIFHTPSGEFTLTDQTSVAGTWVNYQPVSPEGHTLSHGDVIHFGALTYRFVSAKPPAAPKPTIIPLEEA